MAFITVIVVSSISVTVKLNAQEGVSKHNFEVQDNKIRPSVQQSNSPVIENYMSVPQEYSPVNGDVYIYAQKIYDNDSDFLIAEVFYEVPGSEEWKSKNLIHDPLDSFNPHSMDAKIDGSEITESGNLFWYITVTNLDGEKAQTEILSVSQFFDIFLLIFLLHPTV